MTCIHKGFFLKLYLFSWLHRCPCFKGQVKHKTKKELAVLQKYTNSSIYCTERFPSRPSIKLSWRMTHVMGHLVTHVCTQMTRKWVKARISHFENLVLILSEGDLTLDLLHGLSTILAASRTIDRSFLVVMNTRL